MTHNDYVIASDIAHGFWSNEFGWAFDVESATKFSEEESDKTRPRVITKHNDARWVVLVDAVDYA